MSLFAKREKGSIDRRRSLAGVPVLPESLVVEALTDKTVVLRMQVGRSDSFLDRFRPAVQEKRYELDEFGTFVVGQIDNRRTVLDIVNAFERRFRMSRREAELGVVAFFKILMKRQLVAVAIGD